MDAAAEYVVTGLDAGEGRRVGGGALRARRARRLGGSASVAAPTRIAVYKSSPGVMDEGWTEWLFDTYGYKYTLITPADLRAGNLGRDST